MRIFAPIFLVWCAAWVIFNVAMIFTHPTVYDKAIFSTCAAIQLAFFLVALRWLGSA